ncbi:hypothetical protein [Rhizobium lusitanum]|uniref:hypothetical protein n=1 Tax=Rhizobium lusitanum TaxID=293958 RepID=UPI0016212E2F|nr:hypothetical protein [Rhizobium lusitanum]
MARRLLSQLYIQVLIGIGIGIIAIAKWEGALDQETVNAVIAEHPGERPLDITASPAELAS